MAKKFGYQCPEFRGEELTFGNRAEHFNINKVTSSRFWQGSNVIYEVEFDSIKRHMEAVLDEFFRKKRDSQVSSKELEQQWLSLQKQIESFYTQSDVKLTPNKEIFVKRTLKKGYGLGLAFTVLLWLAILLEMFVIVAQTVAMSIAEGGFVDVPAIVVAIFMGILLAIGGWLVGIFLSVWWFEHELDRNNISEKHLGPSHWFMLAIGIVLIAFVGIARMFAGGGVYALLVSVILGALVAILKGFKDYFDGMRCFVGSLRLDYFKKEASRLHEDRLKDYEYIFYDIARTKANQYNVVIKEEG